MNRTHNFEIDEWYHCYNRGVDKREIFLNHRDYERFLMLLYLANDSEGSSHINDYRQRNLTHALQKERDDKLVHIGAYALMPNHFHLLLQEVTPGGITTFMRKIGTGYTMYFNIKNERTGALFGGAFKSRHVADDIYFKRLINYIHANPAELIEPDWKEGKIRNPDRTKDFLSKYPYSSLNDYLQQKRPEKAILNLEPVLQTYDEKESLSLETLLEDAISFASTEVRPR